MLDVCQTSSIDVLTYAKQLAFERLCKLLLAQQSLSAPAFGNAGEPHRDCSQFCCLQATGAMLSVCKALRKSGGLCTRLSM